MNFFGLMNFQAPYLPWVLCGFSILLGGSTTVDLMGTLDWINGFISIFIKNFLFLMKELLLGTRIIIWKTFFQTNKEDSDYLKHHVYCELSLIKIRKSFVFTYLL